jgi:hypothetical protein
MKNYFKTTIYFFDIFMSNFNPLNSQKSLEILKRNNSKLCFFQLESFGQFSFSLSANLSTNHEEISNELLSSEDINTSNENIYNKKFNFKPLFD